MHNPVIFPYKEQASRIFGKIKRPLVSVEVKSKDGDWIVIDDVLADTGADISLLPRFIGELIFADITTGKYVEIKGIAPSAHLIAFMHSVKIRIAGKEISTSVALADSNDIPPLLGRFECLDLFDIQYKQGKEIIFKA